MNIPDEAVDAAVSALPSDAFYHIDRDDIARILEAAAPHMLAEAWEEGRNADDFSVSIGFEKNPYKPTP